MRPLALLLLSLLSLLTACASPPQPPPDTVRRADVLLLGELHDNPAHHAQRAQWLAALLQDGRPTTVVFEQMQAGTDAAVAAAADADGVAQAGALDQAAWQWPLHRPLVDAALAGKARIVGANLPRPVVRAVVQDEAAVPPQLQPRLAAARWSPAAEAALAQVIAEQHCGALPAARTPGMVRAQRVRDAAFAQVVAREVQSGRRVVLIAGNEHVRRDRGVPAYLTDLPPGTQVLAVGWLEVGQAAPGGAFDDVAFTPAPTGRTDPCAALRQPASQ
ncbi:MAG: ChaN family lipoprotein [Proteobacteria bacterium]|nr:ChaN family lipoprotein [Pseudomonadota bacterium]